MPAGHGVQTSTETPTAQVAIPSDALPMAIIGWAGYVPNAVQSESSLHAIRMLFACSPMLFGVLALFFLVQFPINREASKLIQ